MHSDKETSMDTNEVKKLMEKTFGSRMGFLGYQILTLSMTGQLCDLTFFSKSPAIDVKIDQQINLALIYGAGAEKLKEKLDNIKLSNGDIVSISEIWTINPMPQGGFSKEELEAVDLRKAEEKDGPNGETLRKMISDTYHCKTKEDENYYLRRFIAS